MKVFIATLLCCLRFIIGQAQTADTVRVYSSEGEQEDGWAKAFFVPAAAREVHERYKGDIQFLNDHTFRFGEQVLRVEPDTTGLLAIFASGLVYPALFSGRDVQVVAGVKEMEFLRTPTARRFRMQVRFMGMANHVLYFFELTNDKATADTPMDAFIQRAVLTFFKEYSVLL
jgi:hypothetical protein